jgi:hypothetical protein
LLPEEVNLNEADENYHHNVEDPKGCMWLLYALYAVLAFITVRIFHLNLRGENTMKYTNKTLVTLDAHRVSIGRIYQRTRPFHQRTPLPRILLLRTRRVSDDGSSPHSGGVPPGPIYKGT